MHNNAYVQKAGITEQPSATTSKSQNMVSAFQLVNTGSPKAQIVRLERYHDNFWEILWTIFGNCTDYPHTTTDNKVYRTSDTTTSPNTHDTALECDCTEKRIYRQLKSGLLTEMKQKRFVQELLSWQKVVRKKTTHLKSFERPYLKLIGGVCIWPIPCSRSKRPTMLDEVD